MYLCSLNPASLSFSTSPPLALLKPRNLTGIRPVPLQLCQVQDTSLDPCRLCLPLRMCLGLAPPAVYLHAISMTQVTNSHSYVHAWVQPQDSMLKARAPVGVCGSRSGAALCHWPVPLCSPLSRSSSYSPRCSWHDPHN